MMRHIFMKSVVILFAINGIGATIHESPFKFSRSIQFPFLSFQPVDNNTLTQKAIFGALPLKDSRWLLMVYRSKTKCNKLSADHPQPECDPPERNVTLQVVDEGGKVIAETEQGIQISRIAMVNPNNLFYLPIVPECIYGYSDIDARKIFCFDYELKLTHELSVPLDWMSAVVPQYAEQGPVLWVVGGKIGKKPSKGIQRGAEFWLHWSGKFKKSVTVGAIYNFENNLWEDIAVTPNDLLTQAQAVIRTRKKSNVSLSKESLLWSVIAGAEEGHIDLLVEASEDRFATEVPKGYPKERWFSGRRFFFIIPVYPWGVGKTIQLPFEVHFWDKGKVSLEVEQNIIRMPHYYKPMPIHRAYHVGNRGILFHFAVSTSFTGKTLESESQTFPIPETEGAETFAYFPMNGDKPRYSTLEMILDAMKEKGVRSSMGELTAYKPDRYFYFRGSLISEGRKDSDRIKHKPTGYKRIPVLNEFIIER